MANEKSIDPKEEAAWKELRANHQVSRYDGDDSKGGFTHEQGVDLGLIPPSELGEAALTGLEAQYPDEIEIQTPSAATKAHPPDITELRNTSDGRVWLCAIGAEGELYAKVEATSKNPANNRYMLDQEIASVLSATTQDNLAA